jgi:hypothetical protein
MPNWQPNWNDVNWNWAAANAAADALRRAAARLEDATTRRSLAAYAAQGEWRGNHRLKFDSDLQKDLQGFSGLAAEMRLAAARIDAASAQARAEQNHRESERERWRREKADEERRERERQEEERRRRSKK